jgi:hypothetical protein
VGILAEEIAGSIPAQSKHLCALTCLFVLGLGVSMYNMYVYNYILIRHLESITKAL